MQDMEMTFDEGDSAKVHFYQGRALGSVFLWQREDHCFVISISVGGEEVMTLEVAHACSKVAVTKDERVRYGIEKAKP